VKNDNIISKLECELNNCMTENLEMKMKLEEINTDLNNQDDNNGRANTYTDGLDKNSQMRHQLSIGDIRMSRKVITEY